MGSFTTERKQTACTDLEHERCEQIQTDRKVFARNGLVKRSLDIAISGTALIALSPLFICVAVWIRLTSQGPVLFKQQRLGQNGTLFSMYKFRTMYIQSDERLAALLERCPQSAFEWTKYQKLRNDPRVTWIGRFLRKSSIDELPQLLNVLMGTMSIIGQRPLLQKQAASYGAASLREYIRARPGITGLWQISGRSALPFDRRVELDIEYSRNWSLKTDIELLFKTIPVILFQDGAR